jgi:hypothetical protein
MGIETAAWRTGPDVARPARFPIDNTSGATSANRAAQSLHVYAQYLRKQGRAQKILRYNLVAARNSPCELNFPYLGPTAKWRSSPLLHAFHLSEPPQEKFTVNVGCVFGNQENSSIGWGLKLVEHGRGIQRFRIDSSGFKKGGASGLPRRRCLLILEIHRNQ